MHAYCAVMPATTSIAVAALVRDGLVLLGHRHPARRWYLDCWDLVGGHVEPGELPRHAFLVTRWDGEIVNHAPEEHDALRWFRPGELEGVELAHPGVLTTVLSAVRLASG